MPVLYLSQVLDDARATRPRRRGEVSAYPAAPPRDDGGLAALLAGALGEVANTGGSILDSINEALRGPMLQAFGPGNNIERYVEGARQDLQEAGAGYAANARALWNDLNTRPLGDVLLEQAKRAPADLAAMGGAIVNDWTHPVEYFNRDPLWATLDLLGFAAGAETGAARAASVIDDVSGRASQVLDELMSTTPRGYSVDTSGGLLDKTGARIGDLPADAVRWARVEDLARALGDRRFIRTESAVPGSSMEDYARTLAETRAYPKSVEVSYDPSTGRLWLDDGNHTLTAAEMGNVEYVPYHVVDASAYSDLPLHMRANMPSTLYRGQVPGLPEYRGGLFQRLMQRLQDETGSIGGGGGNASVGDVVFRPEEDDIVQQFLEKSRLAESNNAWRYENPNAPEPLALQRRAFFDAKDAIRADEAQRVLEGVLEGDVSGAKESRLVKMPGGDYMWVSRESGLPAADEAMQPPVLTDAEELALVRKLDEFRRLDAMMRQPPGGMPIHRPMPEMETGSGTYLVNIDEAERAAREYERQFFSQFSDEQINTLMEMFRRDPSIAPTPRSAEALQREYWYRQVEREDLLPEPSEPLPPNPNASKPGDTPYTGRSLERALRDESGQTSYEDLRWPVSKERGTLYGVRRRPSGEPSRIELAERDVTGGDIMDMLKSGPNISQVGTVLAGPTDPIELPARWQKVAVAGRFLKKFSPWAKGRTIINANEARYGAPLGERFAANTRVIEQQPDVLVVRWNGEDLGTADLIQKAQDAGIPVIIRAESDTQEAIIKNWLGGVGKRLGQELSGRRSRPALPPEASAAGNRVAVVGSREYPNPGEVQQFVKGLPKESVVVSGGARGVDSAAEAAAKAAGLETDIHPAEWSKYGKRAGYLRNTEVVKSADKLVAFWDGKSRGTAHAIREALDAGLPVEVRMPGGRSVTDPSEIRRLLGGGAPAAPGATKPLPSAPTAPSKAPELPKPSTQPKPGNQLVVQPQGAPLPRGFVERDKPVFVLAQTPADSSIRMAAKLGGRIRSIARHQLKTNLQAVVQALVREGAPVMVFWDGNEPWVRSFIEAARDANLKVLVRVRP